VGRKPVLSLRLIGRSDASNVEQGGGYIDINSDYTSDAVNVAQTDILSCHFQWRSSSLVAEIIVQARNGNDDIDDWRELDFGTAINISGTSGEHEIILQSMAFTEIRIFVDVASGSGEIGATVTTKAIGS
jgi:hypothetical protein